MGSTLINNHEGFDMAKRTDARTIPVNLGITRGVGPDGFPRFTIDVVDDLSGYPIVHIEMTGDEFARAVTGQQMTRLRGTIPSPEGVAHLGLKEERVQIGNFPHGWGAETPALAAWVEHAQAEVGAERTAVRGTNTGSPLVTFYWYVDPLKVGIDVTGAKERLMRLRAEALLEAGRSTTT